MVRPAPHDPPGSDGGGAAQGEGRQQLLDQRPPDREADTSGVPHFAAPYVRTFAEILDSVRLLDGFALVPVEIRPRAVIRAMADWLRQQGIHVHVVDPAQAEWAALRDTLFSLPTTPRSLVVVVGTSEATESVRTGITYVNHRRDSVAKHLGCPLLWCGPSEFLNLTAEQAPDFWSLREIPQKIEVAPDTTGIDLSMPRIQEPTAPLEEVRPLYEAAKQQGDEPNMARLGLRLARALVACGALEEAERLAEEARAIFAELHRGTKDEAECREVLGDVHRSRGNVDQARAWYQSALAIGEGLNDEHLTARAYHRLGMAAQEERDLDAAEGWYRKALGVLGKLGDEHSVARAYDDLARIAWEQKDVDAAESHTKKALGIFEKLGDEHSAAVACMRLGGIAEARADFDAAQQAYETAHSTFEKLHDNVNITEADWLLGDVSYKKKEFVGAKRSYLRVLSAIEKNPGASRQVLATCERLRDAASACGDQKDAAAWQAKVEAMRGPKPRSSWYKDARVVQGMAYLAVPLIALALAVYFYRTAAQSEAQSARVQAESEAQIARVEAESEAQIAQQKAARKARMACLRSDKGCEQLCESGLADCCEHLGDLYQKGKGRPKDVVRAKEYYARAADSLHKRCLAESDPIACGRLGIEYSKRRSSLVSPDQKRSREFYHKACDAGSAICCYWMGTYHLRESVPANRVEGIRLLRKACKGRDEDACDELEHLGERP